jgi:SAM-dependent methyltransferase
MKLSELVGLKNQLDAVSVQSAKLSANFEIGKISHIVESNSNQLGNFTKNLLDKQSQIYESYDNYELELNRLKFEIEESIEGLSSIWFQESYKLYEEGLRCDTTEYILERRPTISPELEMTFKARLSKYNNWQHPGMIIRPGKEEFIHQLLALDPLYLIDTNHDLLLLVMKQFSEQYQRRLRPYVINEVTDDNILDKIPNDQFGLCLVYNFFNFRPFEVIKKYLIEIYTKLRPGGILIMTFNDCDREKAVRLVENHFATYTPGYLVRELTLSIGYEPVFVWHDDGPSTWMELKKPGEFTSLKGGQSLAKILPKEVAESK